MHGTYHRLVDAKNVLAFLVKTVNNAMWLAFKLSISFYSMNDLANMNINKGYRRNVNPTAE